MTSASVLARDEVVAWLCVYVGRLQGADGADIDPRKSFNQLGLDSSCAVEMLADLEAWLGFELDITLPYDFPTIDDLAGELARLAITQPLARSA